MPISPRDAERLARDLAELFADAELRMIEQTTRRLAAGITRPGWAERKLAQISIMRAENERILRQLARQIPGQLRVLYTAAWTLGSDTAAAELTRAGLTVGQISNVEAIAALINETRGRLAQSTLLALRSVDDAYRAAVSTEVGQLLTGTTTRVKATQRIWSQLVDQGITGFRDSAGRRWQLDTYAEMATRTGAGRAAVNGHVERIAASGDDLVVISDSPEECPTCRPWEGRIVSISGNDRRHSALQTAISAGLFHPNCTHSVALWVPGTKPPSARANARGYEARQQQRYLERGVRRWKRRQAAALTDDGAAAARAKVKEWQQRLRDQGRPRQRHREQLLRQR